MNLEKDTVLNWMLIGNIRYALNRDNGSAQINYEITFEEAFKWYEHLSSKIYIINKLIDEIEFDLRIHERKDEFRWKAFAEKIKKLL